METIVRFYDTVDDSLLKFAVIVAKSNGKWVFCKHKERDTYECPGGHREEGEAIDDTAKRELYEETGAIDYAIQPVCIYSVTAPDNFEAKKPLASCIMQKYRALKASCIARSKGLNCLRNYQRIGRIQRFNHCY